MTLGPRGRNVLLDKAGPGGTEARRHGGTEAQGWEVHSLPAQVQPQTQELVPPFVGKSSAGFKRSFKIECFRALWIGRRLFSSLPILI